MMTPYDRIREELASNYGYSSLISSMAQRALDAGVAPNSVLDALRGNNPKEELDYLIRYS